AGAPHETQHVARGYVALRVEQVHRSRVQPTPGEPGIVVPVRVDERYAEYPVADGRPDAELQPGPQRHPGSEPDAVRHHTADPGHRAAEQAHQEGDRAEA